MPIEDFKKKELVKEKNKVNKKRKRLTKEYRSQQGKKGKQKYYGNIAEMTIKKHALKNKVTFSKDLLGF